MARISKQELEWQAQDDARILAQYQEILLDKARLKNAQLAAKKEVDNLNKDLLIAQLKAMEAYLSILSIRIGLNAPREVIDAVETKESTAESE